MRIPLTILALLAAAAPAAAHPHVWITMRSDVVLDAEGKVAAVNVEWRFDDAYNEAALDGLDTDGDGAYSQKELEPLTKENIESLKEWDYFTAIKVNGKKAEYAEVKDYGQIWDGKGLQLHFTVPLKTPIDPKTDEFAYKIYDPTFFIAMDYPKDAPVNVIGVMPQGCALDVKPVATNEEIAKTQSMLAEKGKDWVPDTQEDFGAMFAQPVTVACK